MKGIRSRKDLTPLTVHELETAIHENSKIISNVVKQKRIQLGYNINDFAEFCRISRTALAQAENYRYHERTPNMVTLTKIAMGLGISIYDLFREQNL